MTPPTTHPGSSGFRLTFALALALAACGDAPLTAQDQAVPAAASAGGEASYGPFIQDAGSVGAQDTFSHDATTGPEAAAGPADASPNDHGTATQDATAPEACVPGGLGCLGLPLKASATAHPIVLAHGAGGFDAVGPIGYWFDVPDTLSAAGYAAYVATLDPFNTTAVRGAQLAGFIDDVLRCTCAHKVNLIGHSQGGLDARYVVSTLGYGARVASVTTIATPHRGTRIADMVLGLVPGVTAGIVNNVLFWAGNVYADPLEQPDFLDSLAEMSEAGIAAFNSANPDDPRVAYYSWAGRAGLLTNGEPECSGGEVPNPSKRHRVRSFLAATWAALGGGLGVDNDGMVSVDSAKWGRFRGCLAADHMSEVGHPIGVTASFDHRAFFREQASFLAGEGH